MNRYLVALACALYVFSPIDLCPELLLGPFGLADDLLVALIGWRTLVHGGKWPRGEQESAGGTVIPSHEAVK